MFVIYGTHDASLSAAGLGAVFATASVGGLLGSAISAIVVRRYPVGRVYLVAQSGLFLGPLLIPAAVGPQGVMMAFFVTSFFVTYLGLGVANVVIVSLRQTVTPPEIMGRMTGAFRTLLFGGGALGGLCGGLASEAMGHRGALAVAAVLSALVVLALVASPVSTLRTMPHSQVTNEARDGPNSAGEPPFNPHIEIGTS
jgi:MFS family permease